MNAPITDIAALEARVGKKPAAIDMKVIDHLDAHDQRWIAAAPFAFLAFGDADGIAITAAGGAPGFAEVADAQRLRVPRALQDDAIPAREGSGFGSLFLIPGCGETLRVNGRVAAVDADSVTIEVEDDGCGIEGEQLERVFDPFYTTKDVGKGTGLGLSITYGIVSRHGGRIEVRSEPGQGACFHLELPVEGPDQEEPAAQVEPEGGA